MPLICKIYNQPKYKNTLYLDKDGVLNVALLRSGKLSSPRNIDEIKLKEDLHVIANFSKKKNLT
jgi:hypothetical protein